MKRRNIILTAVIVFVLMASTSYATYALTPVGSGTFNVQLVSAGSPNIYVLSLTVGGNSCTYNSGSYTCPSVQVTVGHQLVLAINVQNNGTASGNVYTLTSCTLTCPFGVSTSDQYNYNNQYILPQNQGEILNSFVNTNSSASTGTIGITITVY